MKENRVKTALQMFLAIFIWFMIKKSYDWFLYDIVGKVVPDVINRCISSMVVPYAIALPVFLFIIKNMPTKKSEQQDFGMKQLSTAFIIQSGYGFPVFVIINIICTILGLGTGSEAVGALQDNFLLYVFILLIFNPIFEELLFRKYVLERLLPLGDTYAIILGAIMFALPHVVSQGIPQMFYAFIIACIWSYVTIKSGKLRYAIVLHGLANLWGSFLPVYLSKLPLGSIFQMLIWCVIMPILAIALSIHNKNKHII
jgi:membrane protease YdiL (CAAX protease family)